MTSQTEQESNLWFLFSVSLLSQVLRLLINSDFWQTALCDVTKRAPIPLMPSVDKALFLVAGCKHGAKRADFCTKQVEKGENPSSVKSTPLRLALCIQHTDEEPPTDPQWKHSDGALRFMFFTGDIHDDGWS